jgi:hypothetical protein
MKQLLLLVYTSIRGLGLVQIYGLVERAFAHRFFQADSTADQLLGAVWR